MRSFYLLLFGSLALLLTLSGCGIFFPVETPEPLLPIDTPTPAPPLVFPPTPTPVVIVVDPPTPTPIVIVVDPATPTPIVIVVTPTPRVVVILPETGADLSVQPNLLDSLWPLGLIALGLSLTVYGLLSRRR